MAYGYGPGLTPYDRKTQLANLLIGQSFQNQPTMGGIGGAGQALGALAQAYAGRSLADKATAEQSAQQQALRARLEALVGGGQPDMAPPVPGGPPGAAGPLGRAGPRGMGEPAGMAPALPGQAQPQTGDMGRDKRLLALALEIDPTGELAYKQLAEKPDQPKVPTTRTVRIGEEQVTQEYNPATGQWSEVGRGLAFAPPAQTTINNNMPGRVEQTAFEKAFGTKLAETYSEVQTSGMNAPAKIAKYQRLGALLGEINTGKYKGTTNEIKKAAKALLPFDIEKLGITDDTAPVDTAKAISAGLALELRNPAGGAGMPGAMSDKDRDFLQSMIASVETTPEAVPLMIEAAIKLEQRSHEVARIMRDYRKAHGGNMDDGVFDKLAEYANANPLFTDADAAKIGALVEGGGPQQPGIPTFTSPADPGLASLPSGSVFYDANGVMRFKP